MKNNTIETKKLKSQTEHGNDVLCRLDITKSLYDQGSEKEKDVTVSTIEANNAGNTPRKSSILETIEYQSQFLRKLDMNILSNYKENNFVISSTGNVFSDGTVNSDVEVENNPFTTTQLVATVPITRDAARRLPRGEQGNFNFDDPLATDAFQRLVMQLIHKLPYELENLFINGDTASANTLLKVNDGLLKLAGDTYAAGAAALDRDAVYEVLYNQLDQSATTSPGLHGLVANATYLDLKGTQADKASDLGDKIQGPNNPIVDNAEIIRIPTMPAANALFGNLGLGANVQAAMEQDIIIDLEKEGTGYVLRLYAYVDIIALQPEKVLKVTGIA